MKGIRWAWMLAAVVAAVSAGAAGARAEDPWTEEEPDGALWVWNAGPAWRAGVEYTRDQRNVEWKGAEQLWTGDTVEGVVKWAPTAWMNLEGRVGAGRGKVDFGGAGAGGMGVAWGAGLGVDVWEIAPADAAWRVFVRAEGAVKGRHGGESDGVKVGWMEYTAFLPVTYELLMERSPRSAYSTDFHRLDLFAGPVWSLVDGDWEGFGMKRDFDSKRDVGAAAGARIWLTERVGIWGRADFYDECGFRGGMEYRF